MTETPASLPLQDVLEQFAMEASTGRQILERYIQSYPDYAVDLVDLSREMDRLPPYPSGDLTLEEEELIEAAWRRHQASAPRPAANPLSALTIPQMRSAAATLGVPRQVLTAFRERMVISASVPDRFMTRFAEAIGRHAGAVRDWLEHGEMQEAARSFKAADKPDEASQVTLDRLLADAEVSSERRAELLSDSD